MDLINWSLNAIYTLFSMRSRGSGEPDRYTMGRWHNWRVLLLVGLLIDCQHTMDRWHNLMVLFLVGLSIEDAEDILFETVIKCFLLIGAGLAFFYRRIKKAVFSAVIEMMERALSSQNVLIECSTNKILEKHASVECKLDDILEKVTAVVSCQNLHFEHINNITERKIENIMEKLTALQRDIERPVSIY